MSNNSVALALAQDESAARREIDWNALALAISSTPRWARKRAQLKCKLGEKFSLTEQRVRL
jgi:hypothetical protein